MLSPSGCSSSPNTLQEPRDLARSFTPDGRPLPPFLRVSSDGFFGTADAVQSVLRFRRMDADGNPIFEVRDRLYPPGDGRGPVVIDMAFSMSLGEPLPLKGSALVAPGGELRA